MSGCVSGCVCLSLKFDWLLPAGSVRRAALPVFRLLMGRFWGFSPRRVKVKVKVKFGSSSLPNLTLIGSGVGVYGPQNWKKLKFTNIIAPKGRVPCTIFTKFTGFMRVLSLHNSAKFRCFISTNHKTINNLLRWRRFQSNFRRPLAAKLWTGPKNVLALKWWHGPPLSPCKIRCKSHDARRRERTKCDVFHFVGLFFFWK